MSLAPESLSEEWGKFQKAPDEISLLIQQKEMVAEEIGNERLMIDEFQERLIGLSKSKYPDYSPEYTKSYKLAKYWKDNLWVSVAIGFLSFVVFLIILLPLPISYPAWKIVVFSIAAGLAIFTIAMINPVIDYIPKHSKEEIGKQLNQEFEQRKYLKKLYQTEFIDFKDHGLVTLQRAHDYMILNTFDMRLEKLRRSA